MSHYLIYLVYLGAVSTSGYALFRLIMGFFDWSDVLWEKIEENELGNNPILKFLSTLVFIFIAGLILSLEWQNHK